MAGVNFKNEEEVQEYLKNIGTEYRFSCFKEKKPEGCHLLGDYLEAVSQDFEAAAKVYKENCDERKFARSCMKFGNYCYLGKGIGLKDDLQEALRYFKIACDLNSPEGCLHAGAMLTQEKKMEKNYTEGLKYLEKSCSLGNDKGCFFASGLYIAGAEGIPVNKTKASELSLLACNGGNIYACMNLSRMYKLGDGVEKDDKKSNEFKERAKEIRDNIKKRIDLQQYT